MKLEMKWNMGILLGLALMLALVAVSVPALAETDECWGSRECLYWNDPNNLPDRLSAPYVLTTDVVLSQPWVLDGGERNLCLNGHTISFYVQEDIWYAVGNNYNAIELLNGATLNIYDHTGRGVIRGNEARAVVHIASGEFNLYGGTITGGACGVYVDKTETSPKGAFHMYGGTITGNNTGAAGTSLNAMNGGVFVKAGEFTVSGSAKVTGNTDVNGTPANVILMGNNKIGVTGPLNWSGSASFGVSVLSVVVNDSDSREFTSGLGGKGTARFFVSDRQKTNVVIGLNNNGEAMIGKKAVIRFDPGEGSGTMDAVNTVKGSQYMLPYPYAITAPAGKIFNGWIVDHTGEPLDAYTTINVESIRVYLTADWKKGTNPIAQHAHQWKFTLDTSDSGKATVTCIGNQMYAGECPYHDTPRWIQMNVSPTEKTYDGRSGFSVSVEKQPLVLNPIYTVGFPDTDEIRVKNAVWYDASEQPLSGAPANAGAYTVKVKVYDARHEDNCIELTKNVEIKKAAP